MPKFRKILKHIQFMRYFILKFGLILLAITLFSCQHNINKNDKNNNLKYFYNEGTAHGTFYHIKYEYNKDLQKEIEQRTHEIDMALSTFVDSSIISQINQDKDSIVLDSLFIKVFNAGKMVWKKSNGAFDMTVAPLVNAWGFGFTDTAKVDSTLIDSLMQYVGFDKINLIDNKIVKARKGIMLDASAIAKGYSIDYVSEYLENSGIKNYLVEIGGEVRAKGVNDKGNIWTVGIDKPIFDETASNRQLQEVINLKNASIATSGNYRHFYIKNDVMYSHTIDPKTGYPVQHSILSASVIAPNCMLADAYATAFMVLGVDKAMELAKSDSTLECYLIYQNKDKKMAVEMTDGFKSLINTGLTTK